MDTAIRQSTGASFPLSSADLESLGFRKGQMLSPGQQPATVDGLGHGSCLANGSINGRSVEW